MREREREREREKQTERQTYRERERERKADRETDVQREIGFFHKIRHVIPQFSKHWNDFAILKWKEREQYNVLTFETLKTTTGILLS